MPGATSRSTDTAPATPSSVSETGPSEELVAGSCPSGLISSTRVPSGRTLALSTVKAISPAGLASNPLGPGCAIAAVVPSSDGRQPRLSMACSVDIVPARRCGGPVNHETWFCVRASVRRIGSPPETSEASSARCTKTTWLRADPGRTGAGTGVIVGAGVGVGDAPVGGGLDVGTAVPDGEQAATKVRQSAAASRRIRTAGGRRCRGRAAGLPAR